MTPVAAPVQSYLEQRCGEVLTAGFTAMGLARTTAARWLRKPEPLKGEHGRPSSKTCASPPTPTPVETIACAGAWARTVAAEIAAASPAAGSAAGSQLLLALGGPGLLAWLGSAAHAEVGSLQQLTAEAVALSLLQDGAPGQRLPECRV